MSRQHLPLEVKLDVIEEIRKRPELWDPDNPVKNKIVKNLAWEKVAKKLGLPVEKIKSLWITLRKSYSDQCNGLKAMDVELAHKMHFMYDVVLISGKRKLSSPANKKQTPNSQNRKNILLKKTKAQDRGQKATSFSASRSHSCNNMQYGDIGSGPGGQFGFMDGFPGDAETSFLTPNANQPYVQKKTTVRKNNSKGKANDVIVSSWIAGKLLSCDSVTSSDMGEFRNKMVDMLIEYMPSLVSKIVEHENRWYELDGIPEDVCIAVWRREMERMH